MEQKDRREDAKTGVDEREGWDGNLSSSSSLFLSAIPSLSLGNFPTPVARLSNLERALGLKSLWIKRDDLSGRLGGGNKVRKLEYMFAAAQASPDEDGEKESFYNRADRF